MTAQAVCPFFNFPTTFSRCSIRVLHITGRYYPSGDSPMAEMRFECPRCQQRISCEEAWSGHELECPTCKNTITVPANPAAAAAAGDPLAPKVPAGGANLSVGQAQRPAVQNRGIPIRNLAPPPPGKKNPVVTCGVPIVILAALGLGGFFGYGWYQQRQAKAREAEQNAAAAAAQAQSVRNEQAAAEAAAQAAANAVHPPVWTLDLSTVKTPQGRVNGMVAGTDFLADIVRVDPIGGAQVLHFIQGQIASPDRSILVYLHLKPGETLGGQALDISSEMKGAGVPQVTKLWKPTAASPPQFKNFSSGYALKLELGEMTNGVVPGTIFLALPDPEQSVIAGAFEAATEPGAAAPNARARPIRGMYRYHLANRWDKSSAGTFRPTSQPTPAHSAMDSRPRRRKMSRPHIKSRQVIRPRARVRFFSAW